MSIIEKFQEISGNKYFTRFADYGHDKWLVVTHGIGEHCGRYDFMFDIFKDHFNIFCYDLRGHGQSFGKKAFVNSFSDYRNDLADVLYFLKNNHKMKKFSLFGHSMGALITADFMQEETKSNGRLSEDFYPSKVYLSSPPALPSGLPAKIITKIPHHLLKKYAEKEWGFYIPSTFDLAALSHREDIQKMYKEDELIQTHYHSKLLLGLLASGQNVFSRPLQLNCPVYVTVGEDDRIVTPGAVDHFATKVDNSVIYRTFENGRHELHNEKDSIRSEYLNYVKSSLA